MKVLVVDDSRAMRSLVRKALQETGVEGLEVDEAENGSDALFLLSSVAPDVILSDWSMPEMNGIDLLRELRERGSGVKFGFVTPDEPTLQMREMAFRTGAQFLIGTPVSALQLRSLLEQ
jgi:two-component system, chemotaxis family, chemotaxis protein CheY